MRGYYETKDLRRICEVNDWGVWEYYSDSKKSLQYYADHTKTFALSGDFDTLKEAQDYASAN